jgi:predicted esterase
MNTSPHTLGEREQGRLIWATNEDRVDAPPAKPSTYRFVEARTPRKQPAPLFCVLPGHGGVDGGLVGHVLDWASENGAHVIVASACGRTWDILEQGYGPDVQSIDAALHWALRNWSIDRSRVALAGFSDGASYALTIGLKNGDCISHLMAFSPGFVMPANPKGRPAIHVAHGSKDGVLPVACGQGIARRLHDDGYHVRYEEFDGEHVAPREVVARALDSF